MTESLLEFKWSIWCEQCQVVTDSHRRKSQGIGDFGVGTLGKIVPPDFVVFQNFKDQIGWWRCHDEIAYFSVHWKTKNLV